MLRVKSWMRLLPEMVRTLLTPRITVRFPFEPLELPDSFRGKVIVQSELCRGCGLCARDCPAFALELERQDRQTFRLIYHQDRCAYCGQCADNCRQGAIALTSELVPATPQRETLALVVVERGGDSCEDSET
jgi:hydrogenase-4 component H